MTDRTQPVDFGILLALAFQEFVRQLHAEHVRHGFDDLGRSDGFVFRALGTRPMTVSELATRLEISKQGAGQIVDDMERRGYIERRPDPHDGRARLLYLSARGEAALSTARRFHRRYERRLARTVGATSVETLRTVLEKVAGGPEQATDARLRAPYL